MNMEAVLSGREARGFKVDPNTVRFGFEHRRADCLPGAIPQNGLGAVPRLLRFDAPFGAVAVRGLLSRRPSRQKRRQKR
jgi:hypothetical protein